MYVPEDVHSEQHEVLFQHCQQPWTHASDPIEVTKTCITHNFCRKYIELVKADGTASPSELTKNW